MTEGGGDKLAKGCRALLHGAIGVELTLWCGIGPGMSGTHVYFRLGFGTIYASRWHLRLFLVVIKTAADALKRKAGR